MTNSSFLLLTRQWLCKGKKANFPVNFQISTEKVVLSSSQMGKDEVINLKKDSIFIKITGERRERYKTADSWEHQYIGHSGTAVDLQTDPGRHTSQGWQTQETLLDAHNFWNNLLGTLQARTGFSTLHLTWQFLLPKSGILSKLKLKSYWKVLETSRSLIKEPFKKSLM